MSSEKLKRSRGMQYETVPSDRLEIEDAPTPRLNDVSPQDSLLSPLSATSETYELPRDILVAYFLVLTIADKDENGEMVTLWSKYSFSGQAAILTALIFTFALRNNALYIVAVFLMIDGTSTWDSFENLGSNQMGSKYIIHNVVSVSILFIYIWRDINGYVRNVWAWLGKVEEEREVYYNPLHVSRIGNFARNIGKGNFQQLNPAAHESGVMDRTVERGKHIQFRIWILAVFVLYALLTIYSIAQISYTKNLRDKLEVALAIFFVLEIDNWACDLFILQNGVLDDTAFDRTMDSRTESGGGNDTLFTARSQRQMTEDAKYLMRSPAKFARDSKYMWRSLIVLFGSIGLIMGWSVITLVIRKVV